MTWGLPLLCERANGYLTWAVKDNLYLQMDNNIRGGLVKEFDSHYELAGGLDLERIGRIINRVWKRSP